MLITKDQVLSANKLPFEDVPVPELAEDGEARITTMTGLEKDDWEAAVYVTKKDGKTVEVNQVNFRANLVARCWKDETGQRLFSSAEEVLALGGLSATILDRLYRVAKRLNAIGPEAEESAEKN